MRPFSREKGRHVPPIRFPWPSTMKINHFTRNGLTVLAAVSAIFLGACKKAPEGETGSTGGAGGGSGEPKTAAPAKKIDEQLVGYWAPDKASLTSLMGEEVAKQFGGPGGPGAEMADKILVPMVDAMVEFFVFELNGEKAFIVGPEGYEEQGSYEIVNSDAATGDFTVKTTDKGTGETEEGKGNIKGDKMSFTKDGITMAMNRIDEAEFKVRSEKAKSFNPQELLAPIMAELLGGAAGGGIPGGAGGLPPGLPPGIDIRTSRSRMSRTRTLPSTSNS